MQTKLIEILSEAMDWMTAAEIANAKVSGAGTASAGLPGWQANGETE